MEGRLKIYLLIFCQLILMLLIFSLIVSASPMVGSVHTVTVTLIEPLDIEIKTHRDLVLEGAKRSVKRREKYRDRYRLIKYPNGDVPKNEGACTDLIIRAYRNADIDLQQLVYEDRAKNIKAYPSLWGYNGLDTNIDHRRSPNLFTFFNRYGKKLTSSTKQSNLDQWQPGDVVFYFHRRKGWHVGIVSDRKDKRTGIPYIIDNSSNPGYASETHLLTDHRNVWGHFRFPY
ncbi:MAG: DUF1287 domain-containing protein [bacterium]